jgi:membrane fusion protein (multidrug efflux system)
VANVEKRQFADEIEALGTVRAMEAIEVSSNVTDRVVELFFEDGDRVERGDLLVRLDDTEEKARLQGALALQAEQEREIKRLDELVRDGAVSKVRLEEYRTQRDIAMRQVEEIQAQIDDRLIQAPFAGVLGFRRVSLGALVSPGDVIATLDQLDVVKLDFTVPETFVSGLRPGLKIEARTEAYPDDVFQGTIRLVDTRVDPVTRSMTVRAEVPNTDFRLRPGMLMTTVLAKNPRTTLCIPERALLAVQSQQFVFRIKDRQETRATVERVEVPIGDRVPGFVEVTAGLTEGQRVVSDGLIGLSDGAEVEIAGEFEAPAQPYRPSEIP